MTILALLFAPIIILLIFIVLSIIKHKKLIREFDSNIEKINDLEHSEIELGSGHIYNNE